MPAKCPPTCPTTVHRGLTPTDALSSVGLAETVSMLGVLIVGQIAGPSNAMVVVSRRPSVTRTQRISDHDR